jgi:signal transduction histidine kinase
MGNHTRCVLFTASNELINNALKHSGASHVDVSMTVGNGHLRICIEDDGNGIDHPGGLDEVVSVRGFGLFSIRERVSQLGGVFHMSSEPGKGCRTEMVIPTQENSREEVHS